MDDADGSSKQSGTDSGDADRADEESTSTSVIDQRERRDGVEQPWSSVAASTDFERTVR
ncbi:hypothetical protein VB779_21045 [Haloarculaceae archaeon H-GB11]|nr:hypothetical protein [Haloarculaceae archaeon H-GB11]